MYLDKKLRYLTAGTSEPKLRQYCDYTTLKKKLNWKPKIKIESGVKILLNNLDYWKKAPVWTPKKINKATKLWFKYLKDEK